MKDQKLPLYDRLSLLFLSFFGTGYSPVMPGTVGSLATIPFIFFLHWMGISFIGLLILTIIITLIACYEAHRIQEKRGVTTLVLVPQCIEAVSIPVIAAGGFSTGSSLVAGFALGAEAIQLGTRFMMSQESSAHWEYKKLLQNTEQNPTMLAMKKHVPVRLIKNQFYQEIKELEDSGADREKLADHLGKGRAKAGMLDGDLVNGELEAGQVAGSIVDLPTVQEIVHNLTKEYNDCIKVLM